jgi:SAM-dependent methyltransferase
MKTFNGKIIVHKVEDGMDPTEVYCTDYQMRCFYKQMGDGFFSQLDIFNYIQHHKAVMMMKKGDRILDACCGRGLLLPMIRWYKKDIKEYVGVDISEANINAQKRWSGAKKIDNMEEYYKTFKITHLIESVEFMDKKLEHNSFDMIIYTSSIEHMQKDSGYRSLENCFNLIKRHGTLFLSCPNTMNKKDPYDTQYKAHLYEWDLEELKEALEKVGFHIHDVFGLTAKVDEFDEFINSNKTCEATKKIYGRMKEYLPTPWLMSFFPILYPEAASEVLILAGKTKTSGRS